MATYLKQSRRDRLTAVCSLLVPADDGGPGAVAAGAVDYIDTLLSAFMHDPPRIWAGGPYSGRFGGSAGFTDFLPLSRYDELAWRTRVEGSRGIAERERLGPIRGLQEVYDDGLDALGPEFVDLDDPARWARMIDMKQFIDVVYRHVCEGMYGAPEYSGNKDLTGWKYVGYPGDVQPRGYTDAEVSGR